MKAGMTLQELAKEVTRMEEVKRDYLVPANELGFKEGRLTIPTITEDGMGVNDTAHIQIGNFLDIPRNFYARLRTEFPDLLDTNVNRLFQAKGAGPRMVRTLDGNARALLSHRYRRLDNASLLQNILPVLQDVEGLQIDSCNVTEGYFYLKVTFESLQGEVKKGDLIQFGAYVRNSEVGWSKLLVAPFSKRLTCLNGATHEELGTSKNHIGRVMHGDGENYALYSDETLEADDRAFWLKTRDSLKAALSEASFNKILSQMKEAAGLKVTAPPKQAVEILSNRYALQEGESDNVLMHLIEGKDLSLWGYANAITRTAEDVRSYDRASELEALGGRIITLRGSDLLHAFNPN